MRGKAYMKINQSLGINQERFLSVREKGVDSPAFQQLLQKKQSDLSQERLQSILSELSKHETRLSHSQTMQDLIAYKQTIRNFLQEVVQNGFSLDEHRGSLSNGREKRLKVIKQVDQMLVELSEQVLEKQATSVQLLEKMGEIKGLLVNLYL
jgi:uncharacterized protein